MNVARANNLWRRVSKATIVVCLAYLTVNKLAPEHLNADTILFSIISLQNVTLFIWGQDRLANFIPFLFAGIRSPDLNLSFHLLAFSISYFSLLFITAKLVVKCCLQHQDSVGEIFVFALLTFATFALLQDHAQYALLVEGQPYALSYLLLAMAYLLLLRQVTSTPFRWLMIASLVFTATGLNPSVLVSGAALLVGTAIFSREPPVLRRLLITFAILLLAFIAWGVLSKLYGTPHPSVSYSQFELDDVKANLLRSAEQILSGSRVVATVAAMGVTMAIGFVFVREPNLVAWKAASGLLLVAFTWFAVFSNNAWIKHNISHYRYFFPVYFGVFVTMAIVAYRALHQTSPKFLGALSALLLIGVGAYLLREPVPFEKYALTARIAEPLRLAEEQRISYIAGDYWVVWPTVFGLLRRDRPAFGITFRGAANQGATRSALKADRKQGQPIRAVCISMNSSDCLNLLKEQTGLDWVDIRQSCGHDCRLFSLAAE